MPKLEIYNPLIFSEGTKVIGLKIEWKSLSSSVKGEKTLMKQAEKPLALSLDLPAGKYRITKTPIVKGKGCCIKSTTTVVTLYDHMGCVMVAKGGQSENLDFSAFVCENCDTPLITLTQKPQVGEIVMNEEGQYIYKANGKCQAKGKVQAIFRVECEGQKPVYVPVVFCVTGASEPICEAGPCTSLAPLLAEFGGTKLSITNVKNGTAALVDTNGVIVPSEGDDIIWSYDVNVLDDNDEVVETVTVTNADCVPCGCQKEEESSEEETRLNWATTTEGDTTVFTWSGSEGECPQKDSPTGQTVFIVFYSEGNEVSAINTEKEFYNPCPSFKLATKQVPEAYDEIKLESREA